MTTDTLTARVDDDTLPDAIPDLDALLDPDATAEDQVAGIEHVDVLIDALREVRGELERRVEGRLHELPANRKLEFRSADEGSRSKAILTWPDAQPQVTDEAALIEFLDTHVPVGTGDGWPDDVTVVSRDELDVDLLRRSVDANPSLLDALDFLVPGVKVTRRYLGERTVKALARVFGTRFEGKAKRRRVAKGPLEGEFAIVETGEVATRDIPGVVMKFRSEPKLRVTTDKERIAVRVERLLTRHAPALTTRSTS